MASAGFCWQRIHGNYWPKLEAGGGEKEPVLLLGLASIVISPLPDSLSSEGRLDREPHANSEKAWPNLGATNLSVIQSVLWLSQ